MKLYYTPSACSLSPHILLREIGIPFTLARVDLSTRTVEDGEDYRAVNAKGYVPALALDSGEILTEGAAIIQFIADTNPEAGLAPASGTIERARLNAHLNFIAAELHKAFTPLFNPAATEETKIQARNAVGGKLDHIEEMLADGRDYLLGDAVTIADFYLFTIVRWTSFKDIPLGRWPRLAAFVGRIEQRPAVHAALEAEGLLETA